MRRLLVGTDGSESGVRAVDLAARTALEQQADLWIVNVLDQGRLSASHLDALARGESVPRDELLSSLSAQLLEKAKERAESLGVEEVYLEQRTGDPVDEIIEFAREIGATTIVVGKRGYAPLTGVILGSISMRLASIAAIPVIVVP